MIPLVRGKASAGMHSSERNCEEEQVVQLISNGLFALALMRLLPRLRTGMADAEILDQAASCYWHLDDAKTANSLMQVIT